MTEINRLIGFTSNIGWIGVQFNYCDDRPVIARVAIGYRTKAELLARPEFFPLKLSSANQFETGVVDRLQQYVNGGPVDFGEFELDTQAFSSFQKSVSDQCRSIPYGNSVTYGELAKLAGSPRAFRAVGSVMSNNPFPIIVPCHRVVAANGKIGGFTSPKGTELKEHLLHLEGNDRWNLTGSSNRQAQLF